MGFGLIFFGYALAYFMSLNSFGFAFRLLGCAVMIFGLRKVSDFEPLFRYARLSAIFMAVCAFCETAFAVLFESSGFQSVLLFGNVLKVEELINFSFLAFGIFSVIFHIFLYSCIGSIAKNVGLDGIYLRSTRNGVFSAICLLLVLATCVAFFLKHTVVNYLYVATIIVMYVLFSLNLALLYSCYKNICEEGDEEAPRRESRIPFLNRLWEISDKKEQDIYEKTKSYAENKIRQDNAKKKNGKKKKK